MWPHVQANSIHSRRLLPADINTNRLRGLANHWLAVGRQGPLSIRWPTIQQPSPCMKRNQFLHETEPLKVSSPLRSPGQMKGDRNASSADFHAILCRQGFSFVC
eukprot:GGOE01012091.1.p4 GENE.GGOE01012091.1~~GGOE01012091.1.p4  ORF type:complete len:104 (-),score=5.40 GGOE01012091.1:665-976(-)